jgi:hypothetical protein
MAKRNLVTNEIKTGGGGSNTKKAKGGGMSYTRTATNTKTGQKTTKSGTLTPTSRKAFKHNGPLTVSATGGVKPPATKPAQTKRKNY